MKPTHLLRLCLLLAAPLFTQCASTKPRHAASADPAPLSQPAKVAASTAAAAPADDFDYLDEYAAEQVADPLELLNRATFCGNDAIYLVLLKPISKTYETVIPKPLRKGLDNAYENVRYPVRLVNCTLQGNLKGAQKNTEKFLVNTVAGVGGIFRVSDKIPSLADLPDEDTGKTFAKWGCGHGFYFVIPLLGPSSLRDGIGLAADYAMNPVYYGVYFDGNHDWTRIPPAVNALRRMPALFATYDEAKEGAIDPYIAVRNAYIQNRKNEVSK